jgi:hypothetical protein
MKCERGCSQKKEWRDWYLDIVYMPGGKEGHASYIARPYFKHTKQNNGKIY